MALTFRSNGVAGGLVSAAWWNDFYNLLTGVMTDQPVTIGNNLVLNTSSGSLAIVNGSSTTTASISNGGDIMFSGKLGHLSNGDVLDASGTSTFLKANGGTLNLQSPNGTTIMQFKAGAIEVQSWLGIRTISGTQLGEFKGNGNLVIAGGTFQSAGGSVSTGSGGSFDSFDVAEVFECDRVYPKGTVLCPGPNDKMIQCAHDNCHAAVVVSDSPGLGLGVPDPALNHNYIAMAGRVNVLTAADLPTRTLVVSDGRGGVRAVKPGEAAFALGFTLNATAVIDGHPEVGLFLRPMFCVLKGS